MTEERYNHLMKFDCEENLTQDEVKEGWHFCLEFDGLLRNNNEEEPEAFKCDCLKDWKP